jgi:hypothetical protein
MAREILQAINSLSEETTQVYILSGEADLFRQRLRLYYDNESWKAVLWRRCWYNPLRMISSLHPVLSASF